MGMILSILQIHAISTIRLIVAGQQSENADRVFSDESNQTSKGRDLSIPVSCTLNGEYWLIKSAGSGYWH